MVVGEAPVVTPVDPAAAPGAFALGSVRAFFGTEGACASSARGFLGDILASQHRGLRLGRVTGRRARRCERADRGARKKLLVNHMATERMMRWC